MIARNMPASEAFDFNRAENDAGSGEYDTPSALADTREIARVRFTEFKGRANVWLVILRNGVTSRIEIEDTEAWATAIVADGDAVSVEAQLSRGSRVTGILELLE
ncbi:MAG: hypothetical protein ACRCWJ_15170 [Casimicrobium sp.]